MGKGEPKGESHHQGKEAFMRAVMKT